MPSKHKILVPLAEGFEEIEAVTIIDVLRRAELDVTVAGLKGREVRGSHAIALVADAELGDLDFDSFDVLVLPGGMPGTRNLAADERILGLVRHLHERGKRTAAICAAPLVLHAAGVIRGIEVTSHPSVRKELVDAFVRTDARVVRSGAITTSQGAGTAMEFALALVNDLCGPDTATRLAQAMIVAL